MDDSIESAPRPRRLKMPAGYLAAADEETLLPWSHVVARLEQARNYWLATTRPGGQPHVTPIWGVWVDEALYFDGIPTAQWARNMATNPHIAVHLESGDDVVIVEGEAEDVPSITDAHLATRIVKAWDAKYGRLHPSPATDGIFRLRPRTARAWTQFPDYATTWRFSDA
ncbi:MAG: pyridoxamine 5'-phosphate oxidase family protein [Chloroflexota bacterium]|nr:pyridoxamine 5'-phosphate oxidase family protein [Chloroflexota bacterium]